MNDFHEFRQGEIYFQLTEDEQGVTSIVQEGIEPGLAGSLVDLKVKQPRSPKTAFAIANPHPGDDVSRKITEGVVSHTIDIAFVVNPTRHPDLVLKKLGDDRVLFWKKRGAGTLPKRILADVNLVQMQEILGKTHSKEFKDWSLISTSSLELIRTLTLSGQGIGILPERVAKADGADLVPYDSSLPTYDDKIFLVYRKEVLLSKAGRELIRLASFEL